VRRASRVKGRARCDVSVLCGSVRGGLRKGSHEGSEQEMLGSSPKKLMKMLFVNC